LKKWISLFLFFNFLFLNADELNIPTRLSLYKPFYWVQGVNDQYNHSDTKLSLGFKYQLVEDLNLFGAYTEYLMWDTRADSAPFRDINHNPELFYRQFVSSNWLTYVDYGIFEHMSNGRDGDDSRSIDRRYLRFKSQRISRLAPFTNVSQNITFEFKYFDYIPGSMSDNRDYDNYVASCQLKFTAKQLINFHALKDSETYIVITPGKNPKTLDFDRGSIEIGHIFNYEFWGLNPRIYLQVFNGFAENMLDYDQVQHAVRVGVIIF
jgi:phospholipase A1